MTDSYEAKTSSVINGGTGMNETSIGFENQPVHQMRQFNTIGVMGLGYVGIPLMMAISEKGANALGFDILQHRVDQLNEGQSYLNTFSDADIKTHLDTKRFQATTDMSRLSECDAILICVPTPLNNHREPNLDYVIASTEAIAEHLKPGQLVVLESTTFPGTTDGPVKEILERNGLKCGTDFFLAYSPEREDPGNINFSTSSIPKVVGGVDQASTMQATILYQRFINQVVTVSSSRVAEAVKLTENIYRAVNIGLVNELKMVFDQMDIDAWEVIDGAATKPFGFSAFYPGPGWGGHCIPIDPFYLTWKAREYGVSSKFIELAGDINDRMPDYVVERTALALDKVEGKGLRNSKGLIVGMAYKSNVDDVRESPALEVMSRLLDRHVNVSYHDPFIPEFVDDEHGLGAHKSVPLDAKTLEKFDFVVICTSHKGIDWESLVRNSKIVVDSRNATKQVVNFRDRIYKA